MRIFSSETNQYAYKVRDQYSGLERFDCYLLDRPNNEKIHAHSFENLEDAARFLIDNPGSGIRMNPGSAIVSEHLVIARDE
jgi:hypothetical protein